MDCRTARLLLDFSRPLNVEIEEHDADALQDHLADCPVCGSLAQTERTADHALGQAVRNVSIPIGLRERLLSGLDAPLRKQRRRRVWRVAVGVAAAACLMMTLWAFFSWRSRPVQVHIDQLALAMPFPGIRSVPRHQVQEFFRREGFAVTTPVVFDYQALQYYGLAKVADRDVPVLVFTKGDRQARVYILWADRFNLDEAYTAASGAASGYKAEVRRNPTDSRILYLILYTGDSLQPFLSTHPQEGET